ncbi:cold shock CspA family protein [Streptomyces sp. 3330]|nr:cold shock CspA family protein [Streptomyces sp. 3330]
MRSLCGPLHHSNISGSGYRELVEGERGTFDVARGQKGPQAENIVRG